MSLDIVYPGFGHAPPAHWHKTARLAVGDAAAAVDGSAAGYDVLVFTAADMQPQAAMLKDRVASKKVSVMVPFVDGALFRETAEQLDHAAGYLARELESGRSVLVTSILGMNRAPLLAALALMRALYISGAEALEIVRQRRLADAGETLSNPHFAGFLSKLEAPRFELEVPEGMVRIA